MPGLEGALRNAANNGDLERARALLADGASPTSVGKHGTTSLQLAVSNGHRDVAQVLVEAGGDPFQRTQRSLSPAALAASSGDAELLSILLRSEVRPEFGDLENALGWAVVSASLECIDVLIEHGVDVCAIDPKSGRNALEHARWWHREAHPELKPKFERVIHHLEPYFAR